MFDELKKIDIIKNKKNKVKNILKFTNVFFIIKIILHQANKCAKLL